MFRCLFVSNKRQNKIWFSLNFENPRIFLIKFSNFFLFLFYNVCKKNIEYWNRKSLSIYIYFACLSVCLYPINVKTAEPMVPKLCEGPKSNMTQKEGLRTIKITKNVCSKVFDFCKSLNMHEQILESARTFRFVIVSSVQWAGAHST